MSWKIISVGKPRKLDSSACYCYGDIEQHSFHAPAAEIACFQDLTPQYGERLKYRGSVKIYDYC